MSEVRAAPLTTPTVTIAVPCYNYAQYLPLCVHSILDQEGVDVDVVIVDDASTDDSLAVAESLAAADPRVRVIPHPQNRGHIQTFNDGVDAATGTYFVLLSADDLLVPGSLARTTALMEAYPNVGLAYGRRIPLHTESLPEPRIDIAGWSVWSGVEWIDRVCRLGSNVLASPEVVIRTDIQRQIGPYRSTLPHTSDLNMWLRAAAVSDVGRVDADHAYYREHDASMSRSYYYTFPLRDMLARRMAFEAAFDDVTGRFPTSPAMLARARHAMAGEAIGLAARAQQDAAAAPSTAQALAEFSRETDPRIARWLLGLAVKYQLFLPRRSAVIRFAADLLLRLDSKVAWKTRCRRNEEVGSVPPIGDTPRHHHPRVASPTGR